MQVGNRIYGLRIQGDTQGRNVNLGHLSIKILFKAMRLEGPKSVNIDRTEGPKGLTQRHSKIYRLRI